MCINKGEFSTKTCLTDKTLSVVVYYLQDKGFILLCSDLTPIYKTLCFQNVINDTDF